MRNHQIFPMGRGQESVPELLPLCLLLLQGGQGLPALSPAGMVAAPKGPHCIQLSWWETPVFSRGKAVLMLVPLWEQWQNG